MASRLAVLLPRLVALVVIGLLATASLTFAQANRSLASTPAPAPAPPREQPQILLVPEVRRQAYVFAKGMLEDGGFAWRVEGEVEGHAANLVAAQSPAPGTRVVDTGNPTVVIRLERNPDYDERGLPENAAPYEGSELLLADGEDELARSPLSAAKEGPRG